MKNNDIRKALKEQNVFQYELAEMLGVSEPTLTRWFRKEWDASLKASALELIKRKAEEKYDAYN